METTYPTHLTFDPDQQVAPVEFDQWDVHTHHDEQIRLAKPVDETGFEHLPYYRAKPRNVPKLPHPHTVSKLHPPQQHHQSHPSHTSHPHTLPPIHPHNMGQDHVTTGRDHVTMGRYHVTTGSDHVSMGRDHVTMRAAGGQELRQPLSKLPTLIQKQKTYAGKGERTG